ncbi:hypothetical protein NDU88_002067 [Pleurodeles waltl]|uniref:Uncharacterized protein n=1 Tax=Pleurodeles waltl TaxID=8319 RepID=A0AAV7NCN3_PLEWA|nr:hypothetical protein NDU88_002067 [Pleurodeles waltl]
MFTTENVGFNELHLQHDIERCGIDSAVTSSGWSQSPRPVLAGRRYSRVSTAGTELGRPCPELRGITNLSRDRRYFRENGSSKLESMWGPGCPLVRLVPRETRGPAGSGAEGPRGGRRAPRRGRDLVQPY